MSFTVTATEGGSADAGIALTVRVLTGQAASQPGQVAQATQVTPNLAITPAASGSLVYGSALGISGTYAVVAGTTTKQDAHNVGGLELLSFASSSVTTASTPVTLGYTASASGISIVLCEIKASGVLTEDASSPAGVNALATTVSTAAFTPPGGSLLVAMVQSNGGGSVTTMSISDTSGLGLTWTEQVRQDGAGNGYSGIWTAVIPAGATPQDSDAGSGADSVTLSAGSPESGTGTDAGAATAAVTGAETGSGADAAAIGTAGADAGPGADAGQAAASVSASDAAAGTDAGTLAILAPDSGSGTDASAATAAIPGTDTGAGADAGTVTVPATGSDTGSGADAGTAAIPATVPPAALLGGTAANANTYGGSAR